MEGPRRGICGITSRWRRTGAPETIGFGFPPDPTRCRTAREGNLAHPYPHNKHSGLTVMGSELRRALLTAPSTSASTAIVRPPNPKPHNAEDCTTNAGFLFYPIQPDIFSSKHAELRTLMWQPWTVNRGQSCRTSYVTALTRTRLGRSVESVR